MTEKKDSSHVYRAKYPRRRISQLLFGSPNKIGRITFTLHRITGLGLTLYFLVHVLTVGTVWGGEPTWDSNMAFLENPVLLFGELILLAALGFHGMNGIRLILSNYGVTLTNPSRPDYPYKIGSNNKSQKILLLLAFLLSIILFLLGYLFIFLRFSL